MSNLKYLYKFLIITISLTLSACSSFGLGGNKKEKLAYIERPAEQIYNQGFERIERNDWDRAKLFFQEVERQHPFSKWARRAMLMQAY
ncbi:MAG: outer membrane protein assembly factor BamD, partial [Hellea sp.]